jgi:hypothetical protein
MKIILDLCGGTGAWSKPYRDAGYDVRLITLPQYNIFDYNPPGNVYGILAAPTCTEFSWARTRSKEPRDLKTAMLLVNRCIEIIQTCAIRWPNVSAKRSTLKFWALENPKGILQYILGKPVLEFNPYDYADRHQKATHLWGYFNLPKKNPIKLTKEEKIKFGTHSAPLLPLIKRDLFNPDGYDYDVRCGQNIRAVRRSITPPGFARAFYEANK